MKLRPYQQEFKINVYNIWHSDPRANILGVAATGSGKTVIFAEVVSEHMGASVVVAHRQELLSQISLALARNGVRHRIVGSAQVIKTCVSIHMMELGRSFYDPSSMCGVAGVDTVIRMDPNDPWFRTVTLGVQDEAHHMLRDNKWGKVAAMFPNARWLGVTATPMRADGHGLGRRAEGIMDAMVLAPNMRDLINMGYLTDYRIFVPPSDLDLSDVPTSAGGDFSPEPLRKAVHRSHIVGDVVSHYLRLANGKLGVTFAVDVESATEIAQSFNKAGVPACVISAKTPDAQRIAMLRKFKNREILQLVNVDLFGEGFDLPAIEVVSMARPTQSFPLFAQQFGRSLRVMVEEALMASWDTFTDEERLAMISYSHKPKAMIIDHVGNVHRHGLPDAIQQFSLDSREKRSRAKAIIPVRTCPACGSAYERIELACPYCGVAPDPVGRSTPHQVDGDLHELLPEALAKLRGEIDPPLRVMVGLSPEVIRGVTGHWHQKNAAQKDLREMMSLWCGYRTQAISGDELRKVQKEFFLTFGIDVLSAQALPRKEANELTERIRKTI